MRRPVLPAAGPVVRGVAPPRIDRTPTGTGQGLEISRSIDVQMPLQDGLQATQSLRALPAPAGLVPMVALTADAYPTPGAACWPSA